MVGNDIFIASPLCEVSEVRTNFVLGKFIKFIRPKLNQEYLSLMDSYFLLPFLVSIEH